MTKLRIGEYISNETSMILGGFNSKIYELSHQQTGQAAVAKVVDYSKNGRALFVREVQALKKLRFCPFVIPLLHYTESQTSGTMILPRMKSDLLDLLQAQPEQRLSERTAKQMFRQILLGVRACHIQGIAHLDLKPENVLVSDIGQAFLSDFGSSFDTSQSRYLRGFTGTALYAAPELFSGNHFDPFLADIWSLGIMCFVLVTGTWPYSAAQAAKINAGQGFYLAQQQLESRMNLFPLSPKLKEFLSLMLQTHPGMRGSLSELFDHDWLCDSEDDLCTASSVDSISEDFMMDDSTKHHRSVRRKLKLAVKSVWKKVRQ
jgi:serine/threonine protein kinase